MAMKLERILLGQPSGGGNMVAAAGPSRVKRLKVDVTSDFNCPFCLLAVKQLQLATAKYNANHLHETLELRYRFLPYQLGGELKEEPISRAEHLRRKFGEKRAQMLTEKVRGKLAQVGCQVQCEDPEVSSTHNAHRLLTYALRTDPAAQLPLAINLFEAHHLDGQHLADKDFLTYQAMLFNLFPTGTRARQWLDSDECDVEVRRAYASAHRLGVTGVPFFVFQQRYAASGAMGVDEFVKLLEDIVRREEQSPLSSSTPSPTSTLGSSFASTELPRSAPHINHHPHLPPLVAPPGLGGPIRPNGHHHHHHHHHHHQHRHHPYRSLSPGADTRPRLPSPLGHPTFKVPSPPHMYGATHNDTSPKAYGGYSAGRSPASTGYSAPSPGVSAERSTAGIDM